MTAAIDGKILERLKEWRGREGSLPDSLEFFYKLLHVQSSARANTAGPEIRLARETAKSRLISGSPLLTFADLKLDWAQVQDVLKEVMALFKGYSELLGQVPEDFGKLVSDSGILKEAVKDWFESRPLSARITVDDSEKALIGLILLSGLKPFLSSYSQVLIGLVEGDAWRRRYCPVCGGKPDFAFLEKEVGARYLVCSRCDAQWLFQRLECPYCGNVEQDALAYYTDDKELYRLYTCEKCRHYLKTIDLRKAEAEVLLPLERFLTFDIDTQAQESGYSPGI